MSKESHARWAQPVLNHSSTAEEDVAPDMFPSENWIAIEPMQRKPDLQCASGTVQQAAATDLHEPPSFIESQFDIILRRQRIRPPNSLKRTVVPSRFLNLPNDFEFAGWGSLLKLRLDSEDRRVGSNNFKALQNMKTLGQFTASALPGNAVLGSVFYALPAVVAVASIYSPISLFISALVPFLWRPIMTELGSALPISGAPYTYILNVSTKSLALAGSALLLLDFASTSVVSAATAVSYLAGEVTLPFPSFVGTILVLVIFTAVSLSGIKESSRLALVVLSLHVTTMIALAIAAAVHWARIGNDQIRENWHAGQAFSANAVARQIFNGFCLGMLGLTGFECTPAYISKIKPGRLPLVLRNLHYPAIILSCLMMTFTLAIVPLATILEGDNVLSILAEKSVHKAFRIYVAIDAIIVLCAGVLTGILSACELMEQLARDRVLPTPFLHVMPVFKSPYVSVLSFTVFSGIIYATTGASLSIVSKMFSLVWLVVMSLFPISLVLLKFNRGRLRREPRTPLSVVLLTLAVVPVVFAGNVAVDPTTAGYFAAYLVAILIIFSLSQNKVHVLRWMYWMYDQYPLLHRFALTKTWGKKLINTMTRMRRQPVCILVKTDEINRLFRMLLYVQINEETSCVKIVHFVDEEVGIPSELEANAKILDEAFPEITVDLIIVGDSFEPNNVAGLAHRLRIPTSLMFMSCPGPEFPYNVADLGTRIITL